MIAYAEIVPGSMGLTACALRSMLPVYVAMCAARAIQCEESFHSMTAAEMTACDHTINGNGTCSSECASFVAKMSSGPKCMESVFSIHDVVAHAANRTCAGSGKHVAQFCAKWILPGILPHYVLVIILLYELEYYTANVRFK